MFDQLGFLGLFGGHKGFGHGGVHPHDYKELTAGLPIRRLPFPPELIIPLSQHRGAPSVPLVRVGQEVVRGEPIARANGFMSVPMHAPATGVVKAIELRPTAEGPKTQAMIIKVYQGARQEILYDYPVDIDTLSQDELVTLVQEAGLVGLGGAAFPTHVKLKAPQGKRVETVIANGCECEPYLTCDHRVMLEHTEALIQGMRIAMRANGAARGMIGIEDNKMDAVAAIAAKLPADGSISVHAVRTRYPQGAEKMLVTALLGKEVPSGGIPADVGAAVYNVGTLAQIGELVPFGRGLIERIITLSGPGVKRPGNYLVPIGTPVRFILNQLGAKPDVNQVILGGPMMGMTVASLDMPITKGTSGILVLEQGQPEQKPRPIYPCIKCSRCVDACPMMLNPSQLGQLARVRDYQTMEARYHLNDCFECGCCSYVCPSNIPLTQYFRIAKALNRERRLEAQAKQS